MPQPNKMQQTIEHGTEFWNDSCDTAELQDAFNNGAVGATSNPVIVSKIVNDHPEIWNPVIDELIKQYPDYSEDEIAWRLIGRMGKLAASILGPIYRDSNGKKGLLCLQINPKYFNNRDKMIAQALKIAQLSPNISIKLPATYEGILAMEEVVAKGVSVNATVSFSVSQALESAMAMQRGLERWKKSCRAGDLCPSVYVTIMVGRIDDHLKRVMEKEKIVTDPGYLNWAGIAVFKKAYHLFQEKSLDAKLLSAAYRHYRHWSEFVGGNVVLTMPYNYWTQFNSSDIEVKDAMHLPVSPHIVDELRTKFADFQKAYDENGIDPKDFYSFGPSVHTLNQFLTGLEGLHGLIRSRMLI